MAEEIGFENGRNSNFQGLVTLTLDTAIPSCITHRPLPIYQISFKSKKLFVDGRTDGHFSPSNIIRSTFEVDLKIARLQNLSVMHVYICDIATKFGVITKHGKG